jgi:hypothetical protein
VGQDEASNDEIDAMLRKLERDLDQLRRAYEKFFVGSRERPPQNQRAQVTRQIRELEGTRISNTSQRFRFRSLQQRFVSLKQKWNRVQREIEQGTYTPHKQKAKKRMEERQKQEEEQAAQAQQDQEDEESDAEGQKDFVELDPDMSRVDLKSLEQELEEMDREGEFEKYVATDRVKRPSEDELDAQSDSGSQRKQQDKQESQESQESHRPGGDNVFSGQETTRKEKLRSLQDKLGISKGGGSDKGSSEKGASDDGSGGRSKSFQDASREPTQRLSDDELEKRQNNRPNREPERRRRERSRRTSRSRTSSNGNGNKGDDGSESKSRGRSNRVIQRSSDDDSSDSSSDDDDDGRDRRLFNRLVDAKRNAGESVEGMNFDDVRDSIRARRESLREKHGRDVSFNIVRKGDSVYLQPNLAEDDD